MRITRTNRHPFSKRAATFCNRPEPNTGYVTNVRRDNGYMTIVLLFQALLSHLYLEKKEVLEMYQRSRRRIRPGMLRKLKISAPIPSLQSKCWAHPRWRQEYQQVFHQQQRLYRRTSKCIVNSTTRGLTMADPTKRKTATYTGVGGSTPSRPCFQAYDEPAAEVGTLLIRVPYYTSPMTYMHHVHAEQTLNNTTNNWRISQSTFESQTLLWLSHAKHDPGKGQPEQPCPIYVRQQKIPQNCVPRQNTTTAGKLTAIHTGTCFAV